MSRILVICPTRDRPERTQEAFDSWKETTEGLSDFCYVIDEDQQEVYPEIEGAIRFVVPRVSMVYALNEAANAFVDQYEGIHFIGDDHRFRTKGWDKPFAKVLDETKGWVIAYADDQLQGRNLATEAMVGSKIIKLLGHIAPPSLTHLFVDNYWMQLGVGIEALAYFENVIIEHAHWANGKAERDEAYDRVNSDAMWSIDTNAWNAYQQEKLPTEIQLIKNAREKENR